jgi:hypothetical protein
LRAVVANIRASATGGMLCQTLSFVFVISFIASEIEPINLFSLHKKRLSSQKKSVASAWHIEQFNQTVT